MPAEPGAALAGVSPPSLADMVTNGANRVAPYTPSPASLAAFFLAIAVAAVALRWNRRRGSWPLLVALVALAAAPGLYILATGRSDSPARAELSATQLDGFRDEVESFARAHGCVQVVESRCEACEPIVRFALANLDGCEHDPPASIRLGADALRRGCQVTRNGGEPELVCGTPSDDPALASKRGAP